MLQFDVRQSILVGQASMLMLLVVAGALGSRPNAVRNVGFRGWRRNKAKLREDADNEAEGEGGPTTAPPPPMSTEELETKVGKLQRRTDFDYAAIEKSVIVEVLQGAGGHVGRAAIALRKRAKEGVE